MKNKGIDYAKSPYARMLIPNDDGSISAEVLEFPGCFAQGDTAEEAFHNLEEAAEAWIDVSSTQGLDIPEPSANYGYSGNVMLRLPRGLHRRAAQMAKREGVSLNHFLVTAIASRLAVEDLSGRLLKLIESKLLQNQSVNVLNIQVVYTASNLPDQTLGMPAQLIQKCLTAGDLPYPVTMFKETEDARI